MIEKLDKIIMLTLIMVISSCSKNSKFTESSFKYSFNLNNGVKYQNDSLKLWNPITLKFHPDSFLIFSDDNRNLLKIIDLKTNAIQELIPRGHGFGELVTAFNIELNGRDIYIFCPLLGKIVKLSPDENRKFKVLKEFNIEEKGTLRFFPLKKDLFVCLSRMGEENRVTYFDEAGKNLKKFGDYPPFLNYPGLFVGSERT